MSNKNNENSDYKEYSDENHEEYTDSEYDDADYNEDYEDEYIPEDYNEDEYEDYSEETSVRYVEPEFIDRESGGRFTPVEDFANEDYGDNEDYFEYYEEEEAQNEYQANKPNHRERRKKKQSSRRKRLAIKFLIIFLSVILVFVLSLAAVWFAFRPTGEDGSSAIVGTFRRFLRTDDTVLIDRGLLPPVKTNVLVIGVDDEAHLTDTMFVVSFDRESFKTDIVSLPRDSWVTLNADLFARLKLQGAGNTMKLNSVYNKAELGEGADILKEYVEVLLGVNIHHWVSLDLDAFRKIVDIMGGVEMEIRPQGFYYYDPTANYRISVPGGLQLLNGEMAEGVVRFRSDYAEGDLARVRMQQEFMKAFLGQLLDKDTMRENAFSFLGILMSHVETDFRVVDLPKYIAYIPRVSTENITFHMLPGHAATITPNNVRTAVYLVDEPATRELSESIFYSFGNSFEDMEESDE